MAHELYRHPPEVQEQLDALPPHARVDFDAALARILDAPTEQPLYNPAVPNGLRRRGFGAGFGLILYAIRYDDRAQIELVQWLGR